MKIRNILAAALVVSLFALGGCATTSGVMVNPAAPKVTYQSVYVVTHGGNSADMDANLQREFLRHGFSVSVGAEGGAAPDVQIVARYADDWKWDMAMYLRSLDVLIYDRNTNVLLANGSWKNSVFHGFYSSEKVVAQVIDDTLAKLGTK
jgi:hypothetical protein